MAEKFIGQAHEWTFQGDSEILQWMKLISENLVQRATRTNHALEELETEVKRTSTAASNAANSLTALQFTKFVESRCHDDDETIASVPVDVVVNNNNEPHCSEKILKSFLNKNLEMLSNCHEKYAVNFDDSDEEEEGSNNYIYQPKNPYNERPLPHIYGSKLWKENWHVGLCDGTNDYSGDEVSEQFSESSTSSPSVAEDNESYDSNTPANFSQWASSTSILNDKGPTATRKIMVQNASSLRGSQPFFPPITSCSDKQTRSIATGSDTSSTSRTATTRQSSNTHDLFAALQNTPPTSASSSLSSSAATPQPTLLQIPEDDIFAGSIAEPEIKFSKTVSNQTSRKPVNLFDDDEFNSVVWDKNYDKSDDQKSSELPAPIDTGKEKDTPALFQRENRKVIDIFCNRSNSPTKEEDNNPKLTKPSVIEQQHVRNQPLNLFESPEASPTDAPFVPVTPTTLAQKNGHQFSERTKITAKLLFDDDDDDDDDFLNLFGSKTINISNKNSLFDDKNGGNKTDKTDTFRAKSKQRTDEIQSSTDTKELSSNYEVTANSNIFLFGDDEEYSKLRTNFAVNKIESLAKKDNNYKEMENEQVNSEALNIQKETESNVQSIAHESIEKTVQRANILATDLLSCRSEIESKKSFENLITNLSEQKINAIEEILTEVKETSKLSNLFEEPGDFDDLFDKSQSHISNKSTLHKSKEMPEIIKETDNILSTLKVNRLHLKKDRQVESTAETIHTSKVSTEIEKDNLNKPEIRILTEKTRNEIAVSLESTQGNIEDPSKPDSIFVSTNKVTREPFTNELPSHNYTGLFLDEPPDDDDFFQTLKGSRVKISLDLDHDLYEPIQTQLPSNTQTEVFNKTESVATVSDYGGLCLFSDVPPDDYDNNVSSIADGGESNRSEPKRIHTMFYDDFNETLEAVKQQPNAISRPTHAFALFDDEPPPVDKDFDELQNLIETHNSNAETKILQNIYVEKQLLLNPTKDVPDKVEKQKIHIENPNPTLEKITKIGKHFDTTGISKLQMPKFNINVQTLLPNVGGKPNLKRSELEEVQTPFKIHSAHIENIARVSQENSNENILTNVCKTRVRAPAKRRPSTRRGRQENYRKSLIEEQEKHLQSLTRSDIIEEATEPITNCIPEMSRNKPTEIDSIKTPNDALQKHYNETEDTKDSNVKLKSKVAAAPIAASVTQISNKAIPPKISTPLRLKEATSFFANELSDSDDELFKCTKPSLFKSAQASHPSISSSTKVTSLFGSDDDSIDDDDFITALRKSGQAEMPTKPPTAKQDPSTARNLFSDVASDVDDDLFGNGSIKTTTKVAYSKPIQDSLSTSAPKSTAASMLENNPLADLLNS